MNVDGTFRSRIATPRDLPALSALMDPALFCRLTRDRHYLAVVTYRGSGRHTLLTVN